jgi:hypothetical protein
MAIKLKMNVHIFKVILVVIVFLKKLIDQFNLHDHFKIKFFLCREVFIPKQKQLMIH